MVSQHPPKNALIYARVSQDSTGQGRSVDQQIAACRDICAREGWTVVDELADQSVGASTYSKGTREGWADVHERIAAGGVDVLVLWEQSRATRDLGDFAELRDLLIEHDVLLNVGGNTLDMSDATDKMVTGLTAVVSENEAAMTSARIRRSTRAQALAGAPHGRLLFGYRRVYDDRTGALIGQIVDEDNAATVRRIFDEYLAGSGYRTIAKGLNADGLTTGTGSKWRDVQIGRLLDNPSYRAQRVHNGEIVGDAQWEPIIAPEKFEAVKARRDQTKAMPRKPSRGVPRLLTGVARCGLCGAKMKCIHDRNKRKIYACAEDFHIGRDMLKLDALIGQLIVARLESPGTIDRVAEGTADPKVNAEVAEATRLVDELRSRLDEAADKAAAGDMSMAMLGRLEQRVHEQIRAAEKTIRDAVIPVQIDAPATGVAEWWDGIGPGPRREVVNVLIAAVTINKTTQGERNLDPSAIVVEWR